MDLGMLFGISGQEATHGELSGCWKHPISQSDDRDFHFVSIHYIIYLCFGYFSICICISHF